MQVILLERIRSLGQMGDVVSVKDGYARNFLLPQGKALRATEANAAVFESQRAQLETRNLEKKNEATDVGERLNGENFVVIRQAGDTGQLYGSVSTRDIAEVLTAGGFSTDRRQVALAQPIKELGLHEVEVALHPEVDVKVTINVARSPLRTCPPIARACLYVTNRGSLQAFAVDATPSSKTLSPEYACPVAPFRRSPDAPSERQGRTQGATPSSSASRILSVTSA